MEGYYYHDKIIRGWRQAAYDTVSLSILETWMDHQLKGPWRNEIQSVRNYCYIPFTFKLAFKEVI